MALIAQRRSSCERRNLQAVSDLVAICDAVHTAHIPATFYKHNCRVPGPSAAAPEAASSQACLEAFVSPTQLYKKVNNRQTYIRRITPNGLAFMRNTRSCATRPSAFTQLAAAAFNSIYIKSLHCCPVEATNSRISIKMHGTTCRKERCIAVCQCMRPHACIRCQKAGKISAYQIPGYDAQTFSSLFLLKQRSQVE